jgi:hypothetical protein
MSVDADEHRRKAHEAVQRRHQLLRVKRNHPHATDLGVQLPKAHA